VKRPQQNRTCCGFAWFNVPKALCISTGACAVHTRSRVNGSFGGYYTMTPQSGHNKTAPAAVLRGSMFPKPCASAQGRVPCTRAAV